MNAPFTPTPTVFTPAMLAERWSCSPGAVTAIIRDGRLRAFKIGSRCWRIHQHVVEAYELGETA
jgi:hypothetical protein